MDIETRARVCSFIAGSIMNGKICIPAANLTISFDVRSRSMDSGPEADSVNLVSWTPCYPVPKMQVFSSSKEAQKGPQSDTAQKRNREIVVPSPEVNKLANACNKTADQTHNDHCRSAIYHSFVGLPAEIFFD